MNLTNPSDAILSRRDGWQNAITPWARLPSGNLSNEIKVRSVLLIYPRAHVRIRVVSSWRERARRAEAAFVNAFVGMTACKPAHRQACP